MSARRPILGLIASRTRDPLCRRCLHQLQRAPQAIFSRARQPLAPLYDPSPRRTPFSTLPIVCDKAQGPTIKATGSSTHSFTQSKIYTYDDILSLTNNPDANRILIDVREPAELSATGRIPTAQNAPLQSHPDFVFLSPTDFEERFGFPRPGKEQEVIFYCKSGVRSRAAAELARRAEFGGKVGEFPGSWGEWSAKGGRVERS